MVKVMICGLFLFYVVGFVIVVDFVLQIGWVGFWVFVGDLLVCYFERFQGMGLIDVDYGVELVGGLYV